MQTLKLTARPIEKLINSLLILCVGSLGTLTYSDAFTPDHEHHFHLSIFAEPVYAHNPLPPLPGVSVTNNHLHWSLFSLSVAGQFISSVPPASSLAFFLQSGLSHGYLLDVVRIKLINNPSLSTKIPLTQLYYLLAWLAPPDKPPCLLSL